MKITTLKFYLLILILATISELQVIEQLGPQYNKDKFTGPGIYLEREENDN